MASPIRSVFNTYDPATLRLQSETHNLGGITRTLVRSHDNLGRPNEVAAGIDTDNNPATLETTDHSTGYSYGNDGRLLGIDAKDLPRLGGKDYGIEYGYTANSASLIHTLTRAGSSANLVTTRTWDSTRDALLVTDNRLDGAPNPVSQYAYTVNALGQRDRVETVGTAFGVTPVWNWAYNPRGELVSARDTSANNRHLGYIYDGIGNRLATGDVYSVTAGVEQVTNPVSYTPNALNQYSLISNPPISKVPSHDLDGNLRFDGGVNKDNEAREYVWDAENRLIAVKRTSDHTTLVTYAYDSQSRRISRSVGVSPTSTTYYLYDGWNVIAEYSSPDLQSPISHVRSYTWGIDLSGSLQGAGGVGGLLAVTIHDPQSLIYYPTYDGNGNVSEYLTTGGVVAAHFEYDPFGNLTGFTEQSPGLAASFAYRFSTKPIDSVTGWFYYLYRYYDPVSGRWPSRDPIEEQGGVNLYGFVGNAAILFIDPFGLDIWWDIKSNLLDGSLYFCEFCAGASDSLTFGITKEGRDWLNNQINGDGDYKVQHKAVYKAGEYTEVAVEIGLTGGSAALKYAAKKKIAAETAEQIAKLGREVSLEEADRLANIARQEIEKRLRQEARKKVGAMKGEFVHHKHTLWGHFGIRGPGGGFRLSFFPTLGVEWLANGKWNLVKMAYKNNGWMKHAELHRRAWLAENYVMKLTAPYLTATRVILNEHRSSEVDVKVDIKCPSE